MILPFGIGRRYQYMTQSTSRFTWRRIFSLCFRFARQDSYMTDIDEIFNDSYERCLKSGSFIDRFYERYIASNEIVAQKFAHTEMTTQKKMLEASLHKIMALSSMRPEEAVAHFRKIGVIHGRAQHDIAPALYDLWVTCLLETVEECDDQYDKQVEIAWTKILAGGIKIMKSMY